VTLHGPGTIRDLTELADKQVRRQIESISGVGEVTIVGGTARQIRVWIDPAKLSSYGLTPVDVQRAPRGSRTSRP
jgi:HAE1 family hydrophobic/amphiphilic exporter-1